MVATFLSIPRHLSHGGFILSRIAIVTVNGPLAAELAVGKMNGACVQGSTLHVEHIRPETESLSPAQQAPVASSHAPEETGGAPKPSGTNTNSSLTVGKVRGDVSIIVCNVIHTSMGQAYSQILIADIICD